MGAGPKPFRFESCWTQDDASRGVVRAAWNLPVRGSPQFRLVQRIKSTRGALIRWNRESFGSVQTSIRRLNDRLAFLQGLNFSERTWEAECSVQSEITEALKREECIW